MSADARSIRSPQPQATRWSRTSSLEIPALMNTLSAVTAFVLGLCMSSLRGKTIGDTLYNGVSDFSGIIDCVLHQGHHSAALPALHLRHVHHDMTKSGKTLCHPRYSVEGIHRCYHHAPDLHLRPVLYCRSGQPQEPVHAHPQPDSGLRNRTGHPVLRLPFQ